MHKSFAVLGLGRFGRSIAMELYNLGADVMVIDNNDEKLNRVSGMVTCAINMDVCDPDALENAGISNMDAVIVAMAEDIEASIMSIITAKSLGVPRVIVKARDKISGKIYDKIGADKVVFPEKESGKRLSRMLMSDNFLDYFELSKTVGLYEKLPNPEWVGKSLRELNLRKEYDINVIAMKDNDDIQVVLDPDAPLLPDKPLLIISHKSNKKIL